MAVLNGADGMVFVADSRKKGLEENVLALKEAARAITKLDKKFNEFPLVLQYNKRDLPDALPIAVMHKYLNPLDWSYYESVASRGVGVMETLAAICKRILASTDIFQSQRTIAWAHNGEPLMSTDDMPDIQKQSWLARLWNLGR